MPPKQSKRDERYSGARKQDFIAIKALKKHEICSIRGAVYAFRILCSTRLVQSNTIQFIFLYLIEPAK